MSYVDDPEKPPLADIDAKSIREGDTSTSNHGLLAWARRAFLDHTETRGIEPVPVEERTDKNASSLFTLWFTANCTLLPITTGISGTLVFGLSLWVSTLVIMLTTLACMFPIAWMGMMGPKTGLRQIIQTRYYFGFYAVLVIALLQLATLTGYTILTAIVGGQTLAALSEGSVSLTASTVIVILCALPISFMGYRSLHFFEMYSWIPALISIIIAVGIGSKGLAEQASTGAPTTISVVNFISLCASLTLSWAAIVSDFSVYISPKVPRYKTFAFVYAGYCIPSIPLMVLGAAIGGAVPSHDTWLEASNTYSVGGVLYAMVAHVGGFGKFVSVWVALSVVSITACSLYSLSISLQSVHPLLARVPRYVYSVVISAIAIGVSIAAASNFYASLSNFLSVVGYWIAVYIGIALADHHWFQKGDYQAYKHERWNVRAELPSGLAAVGSLACSFGLIVPSMNTSWYVGPIGSRVGDFGIEMGLFSSPIFYCILRTLEIRFSGK